MPDRFSLELGQQPVSSRPPPAKHAPETPPKHLLPEFVVGTTTHPAGWHGSAYRRPGGRNRSTPYQRKTSQMTKSWPKLEAPFQFGKASRRIFQSYFTWRPEVRPPGMGPVHGLNWSSSFQMYGWQGYLSISMSFDATKSWCLVAAAA